MKRGDGSSASSNARSSRSAFEEAELALSY